MSCDCYRLFGSVTSVGKFHWNIKYQCWGAGRF